MPRKSTKNKPISDEQVAQVKTFLTEGKTQQVICILVGVSQATISRIRNGDLGTHIPWPNGAVGEMPEDSSKYDQQWSDDASSYLTFPEAMQDRILLLVNAHRSTNDLDPIPTAAPEYVTYMRASHLDREMEALTPQHAYLAEDRRMTGLMQYWMEYLTEQKLTRSDEDLIHLLHQTSRAYTPGEQKPDAVNLSYKKLAWEYVVQKAQKISIVKQALANEDRALTEAICIVFYELRESQTSWADSATEDTIINLSIRLGKLPEFQKES